MSGTGNDSLKARLYLEALHPTNIQTLRHPNKLIGGSTAILWSHHEKLVIIDRFLSSLLPFSLHSLPLLCPSGKLVLLEGLILAMDDGMMIATVLLMKMESCEPFPSPPVPVHLSLSSSSFSPSVVVRFPGKDYYQPARGLFRPVQDLELMGKEGEEDEDDDAGEFVLDEHEPLEQVMSDDMSEVGGYCPSEVPEEDYFESSPSSDNSYIADTKKTTPRQMFAASKSQKSLRSKTDFTDDEVRDLPFLTFPSPLLSYSRSLC
jgi:hypothetical protein